MQAIQPPISSSLMFRALIFALLVVDTSSLSVGSQTRFLPTKSLLRKLPILQMHHSLYFAEEVGAAIEANGSKSVVGENCEKETVSVYDRIGIRESNLALGVNADEVLEYIGTREDLIEKCMNDIKTFDRDRASKEVDKFLMDAEMVNKFIVYQKKILDGSLSDEAAPFWLTYVNWFLYGIILLYVKNTFIMPKIESGEWKLPSSIFGIPIGDSMSPGDTMLSTLDFSSVLVPTLIGV